MYNKKNVIVSLKTSEKKNVINLYGKTTTAACNVMYDILINKIIIKDVCDPALFIYIYIYTYIYIHMYIHYTYIYIHITKDS